jgi:hypothetical protein
MKDTAFYQRISLFEDEAPARKQPVALPPVSPARKRTIIRWAACTGLIQVGALLIVSQWWPLWTVLAAAGIWLVADYVIVAALQAAKER